VLEEVDIRDGGKKAKKLGPPAVFESLVGIKDIDFVKDFV